LFENDVDFSTCVYFKLYYEVEKTWTLMYRALINNVILLYVEVRKKL